MPDRPQPTHEADGGWIARTAAWSKATTGRATRYADQARGTHASVDVGFRSAERQRRVAAVVLAGGIAYRIFFWLLAISVLASGVLGFFDDADVESTLRDHGSGTWIAQAVARVAGSAAADGWWLLPMGIWLTLWAGYSSCKAFVLVHAAIWQVEPARLAKPLRASLLFNGGMLVFVLAVSGARWVRDESELGGLLATLLVIAVPFAGWVLVTRALPNRATSWLELVPGAFVVAVGLEALHLFTAYFLGAKLSGATELYGFFGVVTTLLFWFYLGARLIVAGATLNAEFAESRAARLPTADAPDAPATAGAELDPRTVN